jgi:hypothetical protein
MRAWEWCSYAHPSTVLTDVAAGIIVDVGLLHAWFIMQSLVWLSGNWVSMLPCTVPGRL